MNFRRIALIFLASALVSISAVVSIGAQTSAPGAPSAPAAPPVSIGALIDHAVALFPRVDAEVLEVQGRNVTLSVGRASGIQPGVILEVFREGREIRHPRTGQVLGNAEQSLGRAVITQISDRFSVALYDGEPVQPGDRVRTGGKAKLTLLTLTTPFFVPASMKAAPTGRFSGSDRVAQNQERKPRSLLQRLLGWGNDTSAYSSAETSLSLKEMARLAYTVVSMDVAVAPADRIPRVVITDGEKVFVYKIVNQAFEGDWTYSARAFGRIFSVQFADLTGSGRLER